MFALVCEHGFLEVHLPERIIIEYPLATMIRVFNNSDSNQQR
jgi:hypothetical protein